MSTPLSYRAELANQILVRLRLLPAAAWDDARRLRDERPHQHLMVLGLAEHAVEQLSEEFGTDLVSVVRAHLNDVDLIAAPTTDPRNPIARGAVLAAFLRESSGFNAAAFNELFRPIAPFIDLADAERTARRAILDGESRPEAAAPPAPIVRRQA
ncbi:MAG: hypothetical protein IPK85_25930 [Gemmatimonadetes bacterium]|nr:hypothetical protein [Gemmatimonadota bacterium]